VSSSAELKRLLDSIYQRTRDEIRPGLEGVAALDARLGSPSSALRSVVVAGTNGKGTCARTIEAVARAHGLRTGLFTSPHRSRLNERYRIDGVEVSDDALVAALERADNGHATFFELSTACAFLLFHEAEVDLAILEVGMGGRLDAVNWVDGDVAAVVSIGLDHTEYLGQTLREIAAEKIAVSRVGRPLVLGPSVTAYEVPDGVERWAAGERWTISQDTLTLDGVTVRRPAALTQDSLWESAAVGVVCCHRLGLSRPHKVQEGLQAMHHPLRGERVGGVVFDACHNVAGVTGFARWASVWAPDAELMVALSNRPPDVLSPFLGQGRRWWAINGNHLKAIPGSEITDFLRNNGERVEAVEPDEALKLLSDYADREDVGLLAFGSIYGIGPLRDSLVDDLDARNDVTVRRRSGPADDYR
jgi:dihydrofolate synthase / folylpolyglutamate synthase